MINNFDKFQWEFVEGEFYFIQLLPRKKDIPDIVISVINKSNGKRCIKSYSIYTKEQLENKTAEIISLCEMLGCRAYIHPARRSKKTVACEMLKQIAKEIAEDNIQSISSLFTRECGKVNGTKKIWVIDYDSKDHNELLKVIDYIKTLRGPDDPIINVLETKNGYHIITKPFDSQSFLAEFKNINIHKNSPTILYIPRSKYQII